MKKNYLKPEVEYQIFYTEEAIATEEDGGGLGGELGSAQLPGGW